MMDPRVRHLLEHAEALVGARLDDIAESLGLPVPAGSVRTKGWTGQIIERELLCAVEHLRSDDRGAHSVHSSTGSGPDFPELGVELKTVPVNKERTPLESTAVCAIDPVAIAAESWPTSTLRKKLACVLFVAVRVDSKRAPTVSVGERTVESVRLWAPSPDEEAVLRADFEHIVREYFRRGRTSELTGHVGQVLQVRPKGKNRNDTRQAYDPAGRRVLVGRCGFYLRPGFVRDILWNAHGADPDAADAPSPSLP